MTNYEQHNETFHYEMEVLKNRSEDPEITCIPLKLIFDMWDVSNKLMSELDQLDAMGTNIPSLTMTALRLRSLIFVIPRISKYRKPCRKCRKGKYL